MVGVHAPLLKAEDVLEVNAAVVLESNDLGDIDHPACAIREAGLLDDDIEGSADLVANCTNRQVHACHEHHRLEAGDHVRG